MRLAFATMLLLTAGAAFEPAQADPYTWCMIYSGKPGSTECWFTSYQQCRASASGVGGFCMQNPRNPGAYEPARRAKPRA